VHVLIDTMVLIWAAQQPARLSHRAAERCGIRAAR
jgi:hypothetical protein